LADKATSLIELAKLAASRHDERRKYEWKVSFAFWGLIIAAITKKSLLKFISPLLGGTIVILYAFLWLRGIWVANQSDKRLSQHFIHEALEFLKDKNHQLSERPTKIRPDDFWNFFFGFLVDWAMLFHLVVTVVMVWIFFKI
jgi:hypothetical protein